MFLEFVYVVLSIEIVLEKAGSIENEQGLAFLDLLSTRGRAHFT